MTSRTDRYLIITLVVTLVIALFWTFLPALPNAQNRFDQLPMDGRDFGGYKMPLTPFESDFFRNVNVLKRIYLVRGHRYFITALDGTTNHHAVHDPYYCFKGAGWKINSEYPLQVPNGQVQVLNISKEGIDRQALFWFSDGKNQYTSPIRYWWETAIRRLSRGYSGPEPILIMVQPYGDDKAPDWDELFKAFPQLLKL